MKLSKTQLTEMVRKVIQETLNERHAAYEPDGGNMTPAELSAHLDGERDKKKQLDAQKKRAAMKDTARGMEECGGDMSDERPRKRRRSLSDIFAKESVNEGLYEGPGSMDEFCTAYIDAALWASTDESDESGGNPLDDNYGPEDLAPEAIAEMKRDCDKFQEMASDIIDGREERAGHDFWLTRNGHGAGFWDGDWPEHGDALTAISEKFGEASLYVGDDGMIYSFSG